jgi:uncharacterized protein YndB with AHSA1/START domain
VATDDAALTAERQIPASAKDIFQVLSNPARHAEVDGSGFIRSDDRTDRITANGQTFRMNMAGDHMGGEYQTDNVVTGYVPDKLLAWKTAPAGTQPPGWEWMWELDPDGPASTTVRLTYDWGKVTDKQILSKVSFPLVSKEQLDDSLAKLAEVVSG